MATVRDLAWPGSIPLPNGARPRSVDISLSTLSLIYTADELAILDNAAVAASASVIDDTNSSVATFTEAYNLLISYGQSLSLGTGGLPRLSTTEVNENLCFGDEPANTVLDDPTFVPATAADFYTLTSSNGKEVPIISVANRLRRDTLASWSLGTDPTRLFVANTTGTGGRSIAQLSKGASPEIYASVIDLSDQCVTESVSTAGVAALCYFQGEQDYALGTTQIDYYSALGTLYDDLVTDLATSTSQTSPPAMFISQACSVYDSDTEINSVGNAQIEAGTDGVRSIYLTGPNYAYRDNANHPTNNGYRNLGEKMAQVMHKVLVLGQGWKPCYCISAVFRRKHVILTMHTPEPPLQAMDIYSGATLTSIPDYGFEVTDDDGALSIVDITIYDSIIDIELSRPLTTAKNPRIQYAGRNNNGEGNICDSDASVSMNNDSVSSSPYPMNNWLCAFYMSIVSDE